MKRPVEMLPPTGDEPYKKINANNAMPQESECEICGGLGWISANVPVGHPQFGKLLPCPHRQGEVGRSVVQRLWNDMGPLKFMTYDNFQPEGRGLNKQQRSSLRHTYEWLFVATGVTHRTARDEKADGWVDNPRGWVVLQGGYGCGKTHLAAAIANLLLAKGIPTIFVNVPDLLDYLRAAYSPTVEGTFDQRFNDIRDVPILILDDFGTQNSTPWAEEKLYQILNARYVTQRPTVITTNLELDDFEPRIRSRLSDKHFVRVWKITVPDYRPGYSDRVAHTVSSLAIYSDMKFETFKPRAELSHEESAILQQALLLAKNFAEEPQAWLMFTGGFGVGKTHLAAAIANRQAELGVPVVFVVVPDLLDHLRAAFSPEARTSFDQRFEEVRTAPLLVLDDLGTESATPWAREKLYQIINHRYVAKLPTVITTSALTDSIDPRIRTRIFDEAHCRIVLVDVPSYRGGQSVKPVVAAKSTRYTRRK